MFNNAYRGKTVLVTGHTGFKGSWLCLWLQRLGANVVGYSKGVPTTPSHFHALNLTMPDHRGDILAQSTFAEVLAQTRPDLLIHMAAQPLVRLSYAEPLDTLATNIMGTATVLQASRGVGSLKGIVNITSDKCYENVGKPEGYVETDPMGGHDPYSASKGCAELIAASFARAYPDLAPLVSVRAGNVIGGGDWAADRLIPDMARAVAADEEVIIRRPDAIRPWQYVLEPLSGYLQLGQKLLEGDTSVTGATHYGWNFGPNADSTLTVGEILAQLQPQMGFRYRIEQSAKNPHEAALLTLDSTKAHTHLGWQPVWSAADMLRHTAEWYGAFIHRQELLSHAQLDTYITDAKAKHLPWAS